MVSLLELGTKGGANFARLHVSDTSYIFTHKMVASMTRSIPQEKLRTWFP
jgi:hypothetical protein